MLGVCKAGLGWLKRLQVKLQALLVVFSKDARVFLANWVVSWVKRPKVVKSSLLPNLQSKLKLRHKKSNLMAALRSAAAKDKMRIGGGKATPNDINGDGVRENSVIDKLRNKTNQNVLLTPAVETREVQKLDTENAVDFVMGKLAAAKRFGR